MSKELLLLASQVMKEAEIIQEIKKAILNYEANPTGEKEKAHLSMFCMLFLTKDVVNDKGLSKSIIELNEITSIRDRLHGNKTN